MKGRCLIPEPSLLPRMTSKGRNYTPPLGRSDVQRILGLSDFEWKNIRGLTRSLVRLHHLDIKDGDGKTIRWPEKNPKSKQAAQKKLEEHFPVLSRCQRSWSSEYFLKTHTNNKIEATPTLKQGSAAGLAQVPYQSQAHSPVLSSNPQPSQLASKSVSNSSQQSSAGSRSAVQQTPVGTRVSATTTTTVQSKAIPAKSSTLQPRPAPAPSPMPVRLNIPAQIRSRPLASPSRSPSPPAVTLSPSESPAPTAYNDDNADETGPSQPAKRLKTTRAGRGRPKGSSKAPRAKKQTKAELEQAYQDLLQENKEMRATRAAVPSASVDSYSSAASSRTGTQCSSQCARAVISHVSVSPIASRQLPTPEPTPTHGHGKTLGTPRPRDRTQAVRRGVTICMSSYR